MSSIDREPRCSELSARDEPLPGTTTAVSRWLCLEHRGPWGRDILDGAAFGEELSARLRAHTEAAGVRLMLMHRPGRTGQEAPKSTVLLANSNPAAAWCESLTVAAPADLLDLDLSLLAGGAPGLGSRVADPVTLVCTHGKRDVCCAVWGRPIAAALAAADADVWECSHTGGHRFAPSMISLPTGYSWGRLSVEQSEHAVRELTAGRLPMAGLRGRGCWDAAGQAAELAVRDLVPDAPLNALTVTADGPDTGTGTGTETGTETGTGTGTDTGTRTGTETRIVAHADGRRWSVRVGFDTLPERAVSCGASPKPVKAARVLAVAAMERTGD